MERQSCTKHGSQHDVIVGDVGLGHRQRGLDLLDGIVQGLADLVGHHLAEALEVMAEGVAVALDMDIP